MIDVPPPAKVTFKPLDGFPVIKEDPANFLEVQNSRNDLSQPDEGTGTSGTRFSPRCLVNSIRGLLERLRSHLGTKVLVTAAILNLLQLIVFFIVCLIVHPRKIRERLQKNGMGLMIANVPDEMIDYSFFERSVVF